MSGSNIRLGSLRDKAHGSDGEHGLGIAAVTLACITLVAYSHPHPIVLPLLSIILVIASLCVAAWVALRNRHSRVDIIERLHLAGLILFFGFAAAIMGDPDLAVKSIEDTRR